MTFCIGMRVNDGLIGIADTRVTTGAEVIMARKVSVYQYKNHSLFLMSAGLRSVRDKMLTYFDELMEGQDARFDRLYKAVNAFGQQIRRVAAEDKAALADAGLGFDASCLVGGQLENDAHPKLYLLYAAGNWVEIGEGTPFHIIGESGYGKPILRRALHFTDPMSHALKVGFLAFDSTRISAADVDFPIDVIIYRNGSYSITQRRYEWNDLHQLSEWWQDQLRGNIQNLPAGFVDELLEESDNEAGNGRLVRKA